VDVWQDENQYSHVPKWEMQVNKIFVCLDPNRYFVVARLELWQNEEQHYQD